MVCKEEIRIGIKRVAWVKVCAQAWGQGVEPLWNDGITFALRRQRRWLSNAIHKESMAYPQCLLVLERCWVSEVILRSF